MPGLNLLRFLSIMQDMAEVDVAKKPTVNMAEVIHLALKDEEGVVRFQAQFIARPFTTGRAGLRAAAQG